MKHTTVHWVKSMKNTWLDFETFNLSHDLGRGVYIIWYSGNPGHVVYVGQGDIAERLRSHRERREILQYRSYGKLKVTWASVPFYQRDGVERYLAERYKPLAGDRYPDCEPIAVNLL